jgi:hypothetical protein
MKRVLLLLVLAASLLTVAQADHKGDKHGKHAHHKIKVHKHKKAKKHHFGKSAKRGWNQCKLQ